MKPSNKQGSRHQRLDPAYAISGHGPPIDDVAGAIERTRERLLAWAADPFAGVLHAAKRIFTYRLMLEAIPDDQVHTVLRNAAWLRDLAASIDHSVDRLAERLLDALAPSLTTADGLLCTTAPHRPSPIAVPWHLTEPHRWPAVASHPDRGRA
jgi:hypothetical protein